MHDVRGESESDVSVWASCVRLMAACALFAPAARAQECVHVAEGAAWLWHASPPPSDWTDPDADDEPGRTSWQVGCTPFSNTGCGFAPGTYWEPLTTLYLRQHAWLAGGETGIVASIAIDNDFVLWVNGVLVAQLVKELCATRWDAVIAVPDALWVPGDNVVAVEIIDRGGIANFEMTLTGPSTGSCPPGCATEACREGPVVTAPDIVDCDGRGVLVVGAATWAGACPGGTMLYRCRAPDGTLLRDWGAPFCHAQVGADDAIVVEARCAHSPACPVGAATSTLAPLPYPPADPGPALRVRKPGGQVVLDWSSAPALLPGEHDHVWASALPDAGFVRVNVEAETSRTWTDPSARGRAHYLVRVADGCEIESER